MTQRCPGRSPSWMDSTWLHFKSYSVDWSETCAVNGSGLIHFSWHCPFSVLISKIMNYKPFRRLSVSCLLLLRLGFWQNNLLLIFFAKNGEHQGKNSDSLIRPFSTVNNFSQEVLYTFFHKILFRRMPNYFQLDCCNVCNGSVNLFMTGSNIAYGCGIQLNIC